MITNIDKLVNKFNIKVSDTNVGYTDAINFMQKTVDNILYKDNKDLIWFLNHDHIYTCGTSSNKKEIINKTSIPIIKTNRGGKTTYHGPGQRIVYLMIDLAKKKKDVRKFVSLIENTIIQLLNDFDIQAKTFKDRIGIWVINKNGINLTKEKKIGAIGLRVKKWVTYHGLSFNINPDLSYYNNIHACGLKNYSSTSLKELGVIMSEEEFDKKFIEYFILNLKNY
tara:strand:- start:468 stop:1139 length:672 start_codon:yes stop_codon:yes gene_type:complete